MLGPTPVVLPLWPVRPCCWSPSSSALFVSWPWPSSACQRPVHNREPQWGRFRDRSSFLNAMRHPHPFSGNLPTLYSLGWPRHQCLVLWSLTQTGLDDEGRSWAPVTAKTDMGFQAPFQLSYGSVSLNSLNSVFCHTGYIFRLPEGPHGHKMPCSINWAACFFVPGRRDQASVWIISE